MSYGRVSESFWHDDVIRGLTEPARYFMLYLMSCPHGNRLGLFVLAAAYAADDLDCPDSPWDRDRVIRVLEELLKKGRIGWDRRSRTVFVRYYLRHNSLHNGSVVKGALNDLAGLPKTPLLGDLLAIVVEERKGEAGEPIRAHYEELEDELRRRCRLADIKVGKASKKAPDTNPGTKPAPKKEHGAPHGDGHGDEHGAGHDRRARARSLTVPSLALPSLTEPILPGRGAHGKGGGKDVLTKEIKKSLPTARRNIVAIHGGEEGAVEIEGQLVGIGIEINAYRTFCETRRDPPDIIAAAIAFIPEISELSTPVSLARWGAKDGPEIYEQCVGLAYKAEPVPDVVRELSP